MAEEIGLYIVKLNFSPEAVGAGEMQIQLSVNAVTSQLHGLANGTILEGTQHPQTFSGNGTGSMHATGYGSVTKVGSLTGQAAVSVAPPAIGTYLSPFSVSFGVDNNWAGNGTFSVGGQTYNCKVSKA